LVRIVFYTLLSANLLFLAWAHWIDNDRGAEQDSLSSLPRLQLVGELPAAPKQNAGAGTAQKMALRAPPAQTCTSVGPFNDITSAAKVAGLLTSRGFQLQQRAEEGDTIEGYWVFVGGLGSDEEVGRVVARLGKSGFTDAYVMKNFSTDRRLSVGMFSTRERAEKRAEAVKNMGLQAEVGERKFPGTVYWVDVTQATGSKPLPPEYSFAEVGHSKVVMQPCPPSARPPEPETTEPTDEGDGITRSLPRTTVASAPKTVP
jgi:SPOR domain